MSYTIAYSDLTRSIVIADNNINNSTSVGLVGQNAPGYGPVIASNFLHLLENFSSPTPPTSPIQGQLWYDKHDTYGQLKVNDGNTWGPVNGVWIQETDPVLGAGPGQRAPSLGEMWVETIGMQLKVFNGVTWALVGPPTSANIDVQTGSFPETVYGSDGITQYDIIKNYVKGDVVSIIAGTNFVPQSVINGFLELKAGINLNSYLPNTAFNGVANTALKLRSGTEDVLGSSFFRKDKDQIFNYNLTLNNNSGILIGESTATVWLHKEGYNLVLDNLYDGANMLFRTMQGFTPKIMLKIDGLNQRVGINNPPTSTLQATLDVNGTLNIASTATLSSTTITGYLSVTGDISINGASTFFQPVNVESTVTSQSILPTLTSTYSLGSEEFKFKELWVDTLISTTSTLELTVATARKLSSTTTFRIIGDVYTTGTNVDFNGTQGILTFNAKLSKDAILSQPDATVSLDTDYLLVTNLSEMNKIAKSDFLSGITPRITPTGAIMAWPVATAPAGWVFCDGASLPRDTFADLFALIGTTYGSDNISTFKSPAIGDLLTGTVKYIIKY